MNNESRKIFCTAFGDTAFEMGTKTIEHDRLQNVYFAMAYYQYRNAEDIEGIQKCAKYGNIKKYERDFNNIKCMTSGIESRIEEFILQISDKIKIDVDSVIGCFDENKELRPIIKSFLKENTLYYMYISENADKYRNQNWKLN